MIEPRAIAGHFDCSDTNAYRRLLQLLQLLNGWALWTDENDRRPVPAET